MLARIRLHENGEGQNLPKVVDLLRFSEEDIRNRLVELGYPYDSELLVTGFEDWDVEYNMSLTQAYMLKVVLVGYYDNDEHILVHQLKRRIPILDICLNHYKFLSKNEVEAMQHILKNCEMNSVVEFFFKSKNWVNAVSAYIANGDLLNTSKGFYYLDE
ncbi:hypothetical protein BBG03_03445 [Streptococcus dysgalactiae subsp. equisimilis]|uniref:hypothetical protein n=1 Tax=Streptococcus dysgalactiae TaxID=1334 RepID=UPI0008070121|nr:hypothetical protein [Streptococcus dysgalactiae]OBZ00650.1 hypothetical protein BBG03_03445 [Streptococcus dysgalactiae subsp. equisimilis]